MEKSGKEEGMEGMVVILQKVRLRGLASVILPIDLARTNECAPLKAPRHPI